MELICDAGYFINRGFTVFPCKPDKSPACSDWKKHIPTINCDYACYGIVIPPGFIVVDCDLYKTDEALSSYRTFINASGPSMFCVETGSGGRHLWYRIPAGVKYRKQVPEFPGIDFLTIGAYVIGPGSVTDKGFYIYKSGELPYLPTVEPEVL